MTGLSTDVPHSLLKSAVSARDASGVLNAIRAGADTQEILTASRWTIAHVAALYNWVDVLAQLHAQQVPLDDKVYITQETPLHLAAQSGAVEAITFLTETAKVEVTTRNRDGETPFHMALSRGHEKAAVALLQQGAHTHEYYAGDLPALHYAAYKGYARVVDVILTEKGFLNVQHEEDLIGNTPLNYAVMAGHFEVAQRLLEPNHASLSKRNQKRATVIELALENPEQRILVLLINAGASLPAGKPSMLDRALTNAWSDVTKALLKRNDFTFESVSPETCQKLLQWLQGQNDPNLDAHYVTLFLMDANHSDASLQALYGQLQEKQLKPSLAALQASKILHDLERVIGFDALCALVQIAPASEEGLALHALSEASRITAEVQATQKLFDEYTNRSLEKIRALRQAVSSEPVSRKSQIVTALQMQRREWPFEGNPNKPGKRPDALDEYFKDDNTKKRGFGFFS